METWRLGDLEMGRLGDLEMGRLGDLESQEAHDRGFLNFESRIPRVEA